MFDKMYDEQKTKVASENKLIDNTTFALEVSSSAVLAGTATVPFAEKMLKKEVSATVAGAVAAGAIDVGIQYTSQIIEQAYDNDFDMDKVNYIDFTVDATSLGTSIGTGSVLLPIIKDGVNSVVRSTIASKEYKKQILNSNTINRVSKLKEQKGVHNKYVSTVIGIEVGTEVIPEVITKANDLVHGEE